MITKTPKVVGLNSRKDGIHLFVGKGWPDSVSDPFGFDGTDTLANFEHGGILQCNKAEESVNASQANVACLRFVLSLDFQVVEESKNEIGIDISKGEAIDFLFEMFAAELEKQSKTGSIGANRVPGTASFLAEMLHEKCEDKTSEVIFFSHDHSPGKACWRRHIRETVGWPGSEALALCASRLESRLNPGGPGR